MKLQRPGTIAGLAGIALTAALALAGCGTDDNPGTNPTGSSSTGAISCKTGKLTAQGSTAQANAMAEWIKNYQTACSGASIEYQPTGSGAGITAFGSNTADFAGSDSAMKDDEQAKADARCATGKAIHLPMVVGPIAVVYNLSGVTDLQLKPGTIAKIFAGGITKWDADEIKADNPGKALPSTAILAVHRSDSSGTTDNFTKFLSKTATADWTFGNDKVWKAPGGQAEKGNDGVGAGVKRGDGGIGYVEWSFAKANGLSMAKVANGAGEFTELTGDAAGKTLEGAQITGSGDDLKMTIDYTTTTPGAYPIVLVAYEIVCAKGNPADKLDLLKSFLAYTSSTDGQAKLAGIGYAPLAESVRAKVAAAVSTLG